MSREYLSNIDTALLKLDHPTNLMMITGVLILEKQINLADLKAIIRSRLLKIPRFRQRVVWPIVGLRNPYWENVPHFQLDDHVRLASLSHPGDRGSLKELIDYLASEALDVNKPLWQFHLVENYNNGSALIGRLHHAIADGMAVMDVMLSITDPDEVKTIEEIQSEIITNNNGHDTKSAIRILRDGLLTSRRTVRKRILQGRELLTDPDRLNEINQYGREAADIISALLLREPDSKTVLNGKLGVQKRTAWSRGIRLGDIRMIQDRLGGTVNDVLVSAIAGALGSYMKDHTECVEELTIHATVPVNLRRPQDINKLGNQMGAVFLSLPVDIEDPVKRLKVVNERMERNKRSLEAPVIFNLLNALGLTNKRIANSFIKIYSTRATVVITNVRGPQQPLSLVGSPIKSIYSWVPTTGRLGIGVSILSYANEVRLGVISDKGLVPEPQAIIENFYEQFNQLIDSATKTEPGLSIENLSPEFNKKAEN